MIDARSIQTDSRVQSHLKAFIGLISQNFKMGLTNEACNILCQQIVDVHIT